VNPRIGSDLQYGRGVMEEQTAEVVRNHEGGSRMGTGVPIPKGGRDGAATLRTGLPGDELRDSNDGGAIFGQPHERKPGVPPKGGPSGRKDRNASVTAPKVRRVAHTSTFVKVRDPVDGPRRPAGVSREGEGP